MDLLKAKVVGAQKELRRLKTFKDMEFPVKALQIADIERKLDRLKEMQQVKYEQDLLLDDWVKSNQMYIPKDPLFIKKNTCGSSSHNNSSMCNNIVVYLPPL